MHNNHTPGFYKLEEYRCTRIYEDIHTFASNTNYCVNIISDRINARQNVPHNNETIVNQAEHLAYKQLQEKRKITIFQKIKQFIK